MDIGELKQQIMSKQLDKFYVFTGEEYTVQKIYIQQVAKAGGLNLVYTDSAMDVKVKLGGSSLLKTQNTCYVVLDDKEFMQNEKLQGTILSGLGDNILILLCYSLDKRLKFYKAYKSAVVEFEPLKTEILKRYIQKDYDLSDRNCERLIDICENNYGRCLLELDKVKQYMSGKGTDDIWDHHFEDSTFQKLVEDGTIHVPPKDSIFELVDAILTNKVDKAFQLYENYKETSQSVLPLLSVLYTNVRQVLQIQTCTSSDVAKSTGLTGWQVKCAKEKSGFITTEGLEYLLQLIQKLEYSIKTGRIEENICGDYLLTDFFL